MTSGVRLVRMLLCVSALVLGVSSVEAGITTIRIDKTEPLADGAAFGRAGAYERVTGLARGEVDPRDPRDTGIVNLDKAPRNARGLVEYEGDPRPSLERALQHVHPLRLTHRDGHTRARADAPASSRGRRAVRRSRQVTASRHALVAPGRLRRGGK